VTARNSDSVNRLFSQLISRLAELVRLEAPQVVGGLDEVEQRGLRGNSHAMLLNYRLLA
jgi:hypothetical protein